MNQPIIQPGQIQCEHLQDPSGRDPLQPDKVVQGLRAITFGGLSCREEIASRILAAMCGCERAVLAAITIANEHQGNSDDVIVDNALHLTDVLLAKTRQKAEGG